MNTFLEQLRQRIKAFSPTPLLVFPEGEEPRTIEACQRGQAESLFQPVMIANPKSEHPPENGLNYRHPKEDPLLPELAEIYRQALLPKRKLTLEEACDEIQDPLLFGALLLQKGEVQGGVTGSVHTTASVIRAGIRGVGLQDDVVSSSFLMVRGQEILGYGDCGVLPAPTPKQLVSIALATAKTFQSLTQQEPRVAFLSFSTKGSADHAVLDPTREALKLLKEKAPELCVDGELQFDAAYVPEIAAKKCPDSPLAGKANVFIFPDLNSGNIAYKITQRLGGFIALGPLLQGLKAPWMDLSRGCTAEDIFQVALISAALGETPSA